MLVDESSIRRFNDLLDNAFDKGEEGARLLREIEADTLASDFERKFVQCHDDALAEHAKLVTAAKTDDMVAFRVHGKELTRRMRALQRCMAEAADKLFDVKFKRPF